MDTVNVIMVWPFESLHICCFDSVKELELCKVSCVRCTECPTNEVVVDVINSIVAALFKAKRTKLNFGYAALVAYAFWNQRCFAHQKAWHLHQQDTLYKGKWKNHIKTIRLLWEIIWLICSKLPLTNIQIYIHLLQYFSHFQHCPDTWLHKITSHAIQGNH